MFESKSCERAVMGVAFVLSFGNSIRIQQKSSNALCGRCDDKNGIWMTEATRPRKFRKPRHDRGKTNEKSSGGTGRGGGVEEGGTQDLGETTESEPLFSSSLMTAMRDYFGDDGREVEDYMKRPRNSQGKPMFRIVIAGNSKGDVELAKRLRESELMRGLYYIGDKEDRLWPDEEGEERTVEEARSEGLVMTDMARYADVGNEGDPFSGEDVVSFATWCVADAVFVSEERAEQCDKNVEAALADAGITLFAPDVGKAIGQGELDVFKCLSPLLSDEDNTAESLIE